MANLKLCISQPCNYICNAIEKSCLILTGDGLGGSWMVQEGLGGSRKVQEGQEVWHGLGGSWRIW